MTSSAATISGSPRKNSSVSLLNRCTKSELRELLRQATLGAGPGDAFLEGSKDRELAYAARSVERWYEIIERILLLSRAGVCLDIGTSPLTFVLPRFFREVHSLDFTSSMKSRCEKSDILLHSGGIAAQNGKIVIPVPDETFDCIIFLEVLEHLHLSPVDVLRAVRMKLKPAGTLLLSTPNMMCLGNRLRMVCNRRLNLFHYPPFSRNEHPEHGNNHDRIYMPAEMPDYFRQSGWSHFTLGYHGIRACDDAEGTGWRRMIAKLTKVPLKTVFPSLRQIMLIEAKK